MSNIDINLIRALDGAAPQHKASNANKFELTEGSDGAQHVKIVDSEGNVQDKISVELPDKQIVTVDNQIQLPTDYPDKAVEARLQAIESKQQAILDKLESGLDTRLTGSIVELFNEEVEVSAGAFIGVTPNFKNDGYREAWCTCIADKVHEFDIRLQMREGHYNMFQYTQDNDVSSLPIGGNLQSVLPKLFITSHIRVAIRNDDSEDKIYQINLNAEIGRASSRER